MSKTYNIGSDGKLEKEKAIIREAVYYLTRALRRIEKEQGSVQGGISCEFHVGSVSDPTKQPEHVVITLKRVPTGT